MGILDEIKQEIKGDSGGGDFFYFKDDGKYAVKLLLPEGVENTVKNYRKSFEMYKEQWDTSKKPTERFLMYGLWLAKEGSREEVKIFKIPKSVMISIFNLLDESGEGWDLFTLDNSPVLEIRRYQDSGNTHYSATPLPKRTSIDPDKLVYPEMSLKEAAAFQEKSTQEHIASKAPKVTKKRESLVLDDDEDLPF